MGLMDSLGNGMNMPNQMNGLYGFGNINNIIQQFGGIQNMARQLDKFLGSKNINPKQLVMQNLQGKHFSDETINQFRQFAKQSGMSDEQIDNGLKQACIIK